MLAKAAASASSPMVQGGVSLDFTDIKCLQHSTSIWKLKQLIHVCKMLNRTLELKKSENLVPLTNIVIALATGFHFNVSAVIEKRIEILSQFKQCKQGTVSAPLVPSALKIDVRLAPVEEDIGVYVGKVYDKELQSQLLLSLQHVAENALQIYQSKVKQLIVERNSNRPTDISGRVVSLDENAFDDLLFPHELMFGLDLLANLRDKSKDTTSAAFFSLALSILDKFKSNLNEKCLPPIRLYYTTMMKFTKTKGLYSTNVLIRLPYWQFTMHRIYTASLRNKSLIDVIRAVLRQIYLPNKSHFHDEFVKLHSQNLHEYLELLEQLDEFCTSQTLEKELVENFKQYSNQNSVYHVHFSNIQNAYQSLLLKSVQILRRATKLVDTFTSQWKAISNSMKNIDFDNLSGAELTKMVSEKLEVDKLAYSEKQSNLNNNNINNHLGIDSNSEQRSGFSSSSSSSSINASPSVLSPVTLSRTPSMSKSDISKSPSSPIPFVDASESPQEIKQTPVRRRNRSSSLQSENQSNGRASTAASLRNNMRSNSLQTGSANTQRLVQNAYSKALSSLNDKRSPLLTPAKSLAAKPKPSSPIITRQNSVKARNKMNSSKLNEVNESMNNLRLDEETLIISQESLSSDTNDGIKNPAIIVSGADENDSMLSSSETPSESTIKKVRFTGVPPMTPDEDPEPKRRGWYKKPAVLHYPTPPAQFSLQKSRLSQEGLAFRTSLIARDQAAERKFGYETAYPSHQGTGTKMVNKIKDKLIR
ncbi:GLC7-interacting protein 4 [Kluyveromyces marxianus]|nr:GLC7-interacting protein 4 [Kluyveromyces marxianus]